MPKAARNILAFFAAVFACTVFASIFSTQRVISVLNEVGAASGFGERMSMAIYDLQHFAPLYGVFVLIALLIAFLAGGFVYSKAKFGRIIVYSIAGAVAMGVMLFAMKQVFFGVPIVGGARDGLGLALQILAGGFGGVVFHLLSRDKVVAAT